LNLTLDNEPKQGASSYANNKRHTAVLGFKVVLLGFSANAAQKPSVGAVFWI
jgi:hypothetical protein